MKIIHCADIHLDSRMRAGLTETKARQRRAEMMRTFEKMVEFAEMQKVRAVLISGDLFDTENVSKMASDVVYNAVKSHPDILFFLLGGNHDRIRDPKSDSFKGQNKLKSFAAFLASYDRIPANLIIFSDEWESYEIPHLNSPECDEDDAYDRTAQSLPECDEDDAYDRTAQSLPECDEDDAYDRTTQDAAEFGVRGNAARSAYGRFKIKIFGKCIDGRGITDKRDVESLNPDIADLNIVMLHGLASEYSPNSAAAADVASPGSRKSADIIGTDNRSSASNAANDIIDLRLLRHKSIDYLALGHLHSYRLEDLDDRGVLCYPGCLEARGFDECGEHGFVMLSIDEKTGDFTTEFINSGGREIYSIDVDVTSIETMSEMCEEIRFYAAKAGCSGDSIVRAVLTGSPAEDDTHRAENLKLMLEQDFFNIDIVDKTSPATDYYKLYEEKSLRGEFVRTAASQTDLSDDEKFEIIKFGISILSGEDI